jgi:hypothetical protein
MAHEALAAAQNTIPATSTAADGEEWSWSSAGETCRCDDPRAIADKNTPSATLAAADEELHNYGSWITREPALANCFQNHARGLELATTAFILSKESIWHWAREHRPSLHRKLSRHSPSFIRVSWTELNATLCGERNLDPEVRRALTGLSQLRNFLAHPRPQPNLEAYNDYAGVGESLIRKLGDKTRLAQLREARDALRGDAERTLAEVGERELLAELPGPGPMVSIQMQASGTTTARTYSLACCGIVK